VEHCAQGTIRFWILHNSGPFPSSGCQLTSTPVHTVVTANHLIGKISPELTAIWTVLAQPDKLQAKARRKATLSSVKLNPYKLARNIHPMV